MDYKIIDNCSNCIHNSVCKYVGKFEETVNGEVFGELLAQTESETYLPFYIEFKCRKFTAAQIYTTRDIKTVPGNPWTILGDSDSGGRSNW